MLFRTYLISFFIELLFASFIDEKLSVVKEISGEVFGPLQRDNNSF